MIRRSNFVISLILGLCMALSIAGISSAQTTDIQGNWAENQIASWVQRGLASGYTDGTFKPDNNITRAEFIALTNRAYNFTETTDINYADVAPNAWFATEIARARATGYISGYEDGTMRPNQPISRQETAVIIARICKLDTSSNLTAVNKFKDAGNIPEWSKGAIGVAAAQGYMSGYPDLTYHPERPITRAEAIVALDNAIKDSLPGSNDTVYDKAGIYGPASGVDTIEGNVFISASGITLQNLKITGNLILMKSIGEGDATLKNVSVVGSTTVKGGGSHSVVLENCSLPTIIVSKSGVRIVASGNTSVNLVRLETGAILVEVNVTGSGFSNINVSQIVPINSEITLEGNFDDVNIAATQADIEVTSGTVNNLNVASTADETNINIANTASINNMTLDSVTTVTGTGKIENATINISGVQIQQKPVNIEKAEGVSATIGTLSTGSTGGSGDGTGSGNGVASLNFISSNPADGSTGISRMPTIKLCFDRGVVRDYWDNNQNCFTMEDNSGKNVPITVYRASNYTDDTEKHNIYIKPVANLSYGEKYYITIDAGLTANNGNKLGADESISFTTIANSGGSGSESNTPEAPIFNSAEVTTQGDVSITFDKAMDDPFGKQNQFTVTVNDVNDIVTGIQSANTPEKIKLVLTNKITGDQTVTVAYTKGADASSQIIATDGGVLETFTAQLVTNNLPGAAPTFVSAEVTTKGDVSITFNKEMADPTGKQGQFTVTVNGVNYAVTEVQSTSTAEKIKLVLNDKIIGGQTVTVAYAKGADASSQIIATDGGVLEAFTAQQVTNNLPGAAPTFVSAEVTTKGDVSITFNKEMADPTGKQGQFTVTVNDVNYAVTEVQSASTAEKIKLVLNDKIIGGQTVTVAYTKGADAASQITASDGGVLETFTAQQVTNNLPGAAPTFVSAEVTTKGDVSITFNKEMADPTGKQGQFTVTVNDVNDAVTEVQSTNTPEKIKLVLTNKITAGQTVTVGYTKGADAASQVRAVDGGILEDFGPQAVTNSL